MLIIKHFLTIYFFKEGIKVYKPTSGGWTTTTPANAGASMTKILNDLVRARPGNGGNKKK